MSPTTIMSVVLVAIAAALLVLTWILYGRMRRQLEAAEEHNNIVWGLADERAETIQDLDARNARLHDDLRKMRDRLPRVADDDPSLDEDVTRPYVNLRETLGIAEVWPTDRSAT